MSYFNSMYVKVFNDNYATDDSGKCVLHDILSKNEGFVDDVITFAQKTSFHDKSLTMNEVIEREAKSHSNLLKNITSVKGDQVLYTDKARLILFSDSINLKDKRLLDEYNSRNEASLDKRMSTRLREVKLQNKQSEFYVSNPPRDYLTGQNSYILEEHDHYRMEVVLPNDEVFYSKAMKFGEGYTDNALLRNDISPDTVGEDTFNNSINEYMDRGLVAYEFKVKRHMEGIETFDYKSMSDREMVKAGADSYEVEWLDEQALLQSVEVTDVHDVTISTKSKDDIDKKDVDFEF